MNWSQITLSADADLEARHSGVTSLGLTNIAGKHTIAKREIGRTLQQVLKPWVPSAPKDDGQDGVLTASANTFSAASGAFQDPDVNVQAEDYLEILSDIDDKGTYRVASVVSGTALTVKNLDGSAFTWDATQTAVVWRVRQDVLDRIIDPVNTFKDAAVMYVLWLIYDDLLKGSPESDFYARKKAEAWSGREFKTGPGYTEELRSALSVMQVDLGSDGVVSPFEQLQNYGSVRLVRGGSASAYGPVDNPLAQWMEGR